MKSGQLGSGGQTFGHSKSHKHKREAEEKGNRMHNLDHGVTKAYLL